MDELKELMNKLEELKAEAGKLAETSNVEDTEKLNAKLAEIKNVKARIKFEEMKIEDERITAENKIQNGRMKPIDNTKDNQIDNQAVYEKAFYNVLQGKRLSAEDVNVLQKVNNTLSSGTGEDGGYLIPNDQKVAIKELKRQYKSLETLVNVEPVTTLTGSRSIEKEAEYTPFIEFAEGDDISETDSPKFNNVLYAIKDRGGILPVPNNLLSDNKANLKSYLNKWLAKKQVATRNSLIVNLMRAKEKNLIENIDDVKEIFNVTLDPSIADMAVVVMNQSSFNKFDKMKDGNGEYLLQKDPTDKTKKMLDGRNIIKFSNKILSNRDDNGIKKAPVIIGSLKEAITLFDRDATSLLSTQLGGTAFKKNRTEIRAITREDVKEVDSDAYVFGEIVVE